jgi:hypothetical protein
MKWEASSSEQNTFLRRVDVERRAIAATRCRHPDCPAPAGLSERAIQSWLRNSVAEPGAQLTASRLREISRLCGLLADKSLQLFQGDDSKAAKQVQELLLSI